MRQICIDLSWMRIGKVGGAEQATYALFDSLSGLDCTNRYLLKCPRSTYWDWKFPASFDHAVDFTDRVEKERHFRRQMLRHAPAVKNELSDRSDLLHAPSGYLPDTINAEKLVVTIHDLQHLEFPQYFTEEERVYRDTQLESIIQRADQIICISNFTKSSLIARFGISETRIKVIWMAPDQRIALPVGDRKRLSVLKRLGLQHPFLIYPSYPWKHKNHERLLAAWENLSACTEVQKRTLVLTGAPFPTNHAAFPILQRLIAKRRVMHLGYRTPSEMRVLFQSAEALIFPSEFEGFGLPIAEAFYSSLPVLTSHAGSLPEIAGDAAHYFDPYSIEAIESSIRSATNQPEWLQDLAQKGRDRSTLFSAHRCAAMTLQVYKMAMGVEQPETEEPNRLESDSGTVSLNMKRFEKFRNFSRASERAARAQSWLSMIFYALLALTMSPIRASKRLGLGAFCHIEVFTLRTFGKTKYQEDSNQSGTIK